MNSVEEICQREFRKGWVPKLTMTTDGRWECLLDCGVDILPPSVPRPRAEGETHAVALTLAVRSRDRMLAGASAA